MVNQAKRWWRAHSRLSSRLVRFREGYHDFARLSFSRLINHQSRAYCGKIASEYTGNIKQGVAAADQTSIMRAVAYHIAFSTQDRIPQCYCVDNPRLWH